MLPNHYFLAFRWIWTEQLGLPATPVNSLALQAAIHAHDITLSSPRLTDDVICSVLFCCHHSQINLGFIYLRFLFPELCRLFSPAKSNLLFLFLSGHGVCPSIFGHADWCRDSKTNLLISWWLSYTNLDLGAPKFLFFVFFNFADWFILDFQPNHAFFHWHQNLFGLRVFQWKRKINSWNQRGKSFFLLNY